MGEDGLQASASRRVRSEILPRDSLPSAPQFLPRILALTELDADVADLVALIERDPGLTARILRTANSPFFGQARSVTSVRRAMVVLGVAMVRNLALGLVVWDAAAGRIPADRVARLWDHSLSVALAAQELAARSRMCDSADAFTAGLLHDAGRLVLARRFPSVYLPLLLEVAPESRAPDVEHALLEVDHAEVGGWLFDAWRMPLPIVEAVAQHHDETTAPGLATLVAVANALVNHVDPHAAPDPGQEPALARAAAAGISLDLWREVVDRLGDRPSR